MAGVPENLANNVVIGRFNDPDFTVDLIERYAGVLAAVIVTPVLSIGMLSPEPGFLEAIRDAAHAAGALLLFDEVISLRVARGGAQERFGVVPDLTSVAKIIGGGFPVGAFGGRADVMALTDPTRGATVMHAGTFNGNPVSMAAGLESVRMLTPDAFAGLEATGEALEAGLRAAIAHSGAPMEVGRTGSLLYLDLAPAAGDAAWAAVAPTVRSWLRNACLNEGVAALGINATTVMTDAHVAAAVGGIGRALARLMGAIRGSAATSAPR
jgi:glutamate-1-semialdehyde 2,1-aminomutase